MEEAAKINPFETERIGKLMVRFAVPSIIALMINSIYSVVDQIVIGNGVENSDIAIGATENSISYCIDYDRPIIFGFLFLGIDIDIRQRAWMMRCRLL